MKLLKPNMPMLRSGLKMLDHEAIEGVAVKRISGKQVVLMKRRLLARSGGVCECPMCQAGYAIKLTWATSEVDHIQPVFEGGGNEIANLRVVHKDCHARITAEQQARMARSSWSDRVKV